MAENDQLYEFDPSSILAALDKVNKAVQGVGKTGGQSAQSLSTAWEDFSNKIVKVTDRSAQAQQRYVRSIEQTAAAYGKTGVEKLIAQRDQIIKRLGDEEKLVNRVKDAYSKMIAVEQGRGTSSGGGGLLDYNSPIGMMARAARDIGQGRVGYGLTTGAGALAGLSGGVAVTAGMTAALGALSIASYKAMGSLAELGVETQAAMLKMGMGAQTVGQFRFAARAVGQDLDVFERGMRGLTQAVEDQTSAGDKARAWLTRFGVDISGLRDGTASTASTFEKVAVGIESLASPLEKNKALLDLFKRAGIEMIPVIENLEKNLAKAKEYGFGLGDEEEKKLLHYKDQLSVIDALWERIWRHAKEHLAGLASAAIGGYLAMDQQTRDRTSPGASVDAFITGVSPALQRLRDEAAAAPVQGRYANTASIYQPMLQEMGQKAFAGYQAGMGLEGQLKAAEQARAKLGEIDQYSGSAKIKEAAADDLQIKNLKDQIKLQGEGLELVEATRKALLEISDRAAHPFGQTPTEELRERLSRMPGMASVQGRGAFGAAAGRFDAQIVAEKSQAAEKIVGENEIKLADAVDRMVKQLEAQAREVYALGAQRTEKEMEQVKREAGAQETMLRYRSATGLQAGLVSAQVGGILGPQTPAGRFAEEQAVASIKTASIVQESAQQQAIVANEYKLLEDKQRFATLLSAMTGKDTVEQNVLTMNGIEKENDLRKQGIDKLIELQMKGAEDVGKIQDEMLVKQAEEIRRQIDEIKKPAEQLFTTLLTHPSKFGKDLGQTLHAAAIKPVVNMMSETVATTLQPLIFGQAGGHGGGLSSIKLTGQGYVPVVIMGGGGGGGGTTAYEGGATAAAIKNAGGGTSPMWGPMAAISRIGGGGGGGGWAGGGGGGVGTGWSGFGPMAAVSRIGSGGGGGWTGGGGGGVETGWSGSGPMAFPDTSGLGVSLPGGSYGGQQGTTANAHTGGSFSLPSISKFLGGMKGGLQGIGTSFGVGAGLPKGTVGFGADGTPHDDMGNPISGGTTSFSSVARSPGVSAAITGGGMYLAQRGLLGRDMGTGAGVAEGTIGGAAVGFEVGGPLGAAIGGAAGALAALGEMAAGVKSPQNKAKDDIKSIYHISISNSMADQIVGIANSKYGGNISVATHSPEVREMLGIYAAGTGQKNFPMGADTPHGAGLVEAGGKLSQMPMYQYGNPYTYSSNLPVYGGGPTGSLAAPGGGPTQISMSISGAAVAPFLTGNYITPDFVGGQMASAYASSNGRLQSSSDLNSPGDLVS